MDWTLKIPPLTDNILKALQRVKETKKILRAANPHVITATEARVKLLAWNSGATPRPKPMPQLTDDLQSAICEHANALHEYRDACANAIGPWWKTKGCAMPEKPIEPEGVVFLPSSSVGVIRLPTMHLRWRNGILEQAWRGDDGSVEWKPIEIVNEPDK